MRVCRIDSVAPTESISAPASAMTTLRLVVLCVCLALPALVEATPGLRLQPMPAGVRELFRQPVEYGPLQAGSPLIRKRPSRQPLLESATPFAGKDVTIDSTGVHYQPMLAGFPSGPPLTMSLRSYLDLAQAHLGQKAFTDAVRRAFRQTAASKARSGRNRLEWRVPIPAPPQLRRLIGDEGSLRINGSHTATIGGKSQWTAGEVQTLAGRPSKFPTLAMDQQSQFAVEGSVGEAINIRITQDTESLGGAFGQSLTDQLANQIKLDYKGDEDDIFQEVQAGNTTLALPNTRFVGFNQQHKGLFGIRASGHLGDLAFTTIASHEKSESNRQSFRGGAQVDTVEIHDYQYVHNQWFFLDEIYRERLTDFSELNTGVPSDFEPNDAIDPQSLQIFINDFNVNNDAEQLSRPGVASIDPSQPTNRATGFSEIGTWHRLDPDNDYGLVEMLGYIVLRVAVQERHALAVTYRTVSGRQVGGVPAAPDSLRLRLIKARDARPEFPTWDLEWKNVYRIVRGFSRGRLFDEDKIRVEILKEVPGTEPENTQGSKTYLQLMGLDTHGQDPGTRPDQIIDADYVGLDGGQGVLIFPDLRPFDPVHVKYDVLGTKIPEIYDKQQQRDQIEASRYLIQVINSSGQQRISLTQGRLASIDPKSVDVRLNGKQLTSGVDYNVTFTGEVQFLGETADAVGDPGADLEITFESQDLIGLGSQQKTLLGMRGEYEFLGGDGVLGGTMIYNNVRSAEKRVRVGGEPARTVVWDMDVRAKFDAPLLTRVVDAMPLLKTAVPSAVTLQAEIAQSRPNLNTKGQGYIDDFEGSERPEILSVFRSRWTPSSPSEATFLGVGERGSTHWYNPFHRVLRTAIWPGQEDQVEASNNKTDVLTFEVVPRPDAVDTWGGLMTVFSGGVRDFSQSKFLDIWLRGEEGVLHIDLGDISEDWIPNGRIDTEDTPLPGRTTGDNEVSKAEDVGLDGRTDEQELDFFLVEAGIDTVGLSNDQKRQQFRGLSEYDGRDPADPQGDNWDYDSTRNRDDYRRINGTQGNRLAQGGQRPDTEDLNNDGNLNVRNDFYHHVIDLARDVHVPGTRSDAGWRLFRIKLYDDDSERIGAPDSSRIEFARLALVTDRVFGDTTRVEIAQMEIIGNQWQEDPVTRLHADATVVSENEVFNVTVIGTDENLSYRPPPGVKVNRLAGSRVREREQALVLDISELDAGHQAAVTKVLTRNADYTKYTRLKMFIHGDSNAVYIPEPDSSDVEMFLRFGADSLNYYEYTTRVFPGWDDRNEIEMDLLEMAQLKAKLRGGPVDSTGMVLTQIDTVIVDPRFRHGAPAIYTVRGNPSLQQVRQLTLGVRNRSDLQPVTAMFYVDELRLDAARNDPGVAAYARVNTKLADFMDLDATVNWQQENFRTLSNTERRSADLSSDISTTVNLHKALPGSWGFTVPVKFSYSRDLSLPRFGPNSDVELQADEKDSLRTENSKKFLEFSISKRAGKNFLARWTVDQMNLRMSQTSNRGMSPVNPVNDRDSQSASFSYKMPLPKPTIPYLAWIPEFLPESLRKSQLSPMPTTANYSVNMNHQETANWRVGQVDTTVNEVFTLKETYATKVSPIRSISGDYNLQIDRDLRKKYDPSNFAFGREVKRGQRAHMKVQLRLVRWLDPSFTFQADYQENSDPRRRQQASLIDTTGGINRVIQTLDTNSKNSLSARFNVRLPDVLKALGAPGVRTRRPGGRARAAAAASADEEAAARAEGTVVKAEEEVGQPFFLRRFLHYTSSYVEPMSYSWRRNTDARNFNLVTRPGLPFQLGLDDSLRVAQRGVGLTQQDTWSRSTNTDIGSGLRLPLGFSVKPSFKEQISRRSGSTKDRLRVEQSKTFPSLIVNWGRADRVFGLRRVLNSAQVNVRYEEGQSLQAEGSLDPSNLIREGKTREWRVTWSGNWRIGPSTRIELSSSTSDDLDFEIEDRSDSTIVVSQRPPLRGKGRNLKTTKTFDTRYKLRPRELPLFGKLKSSIDLNFEININSQVRESATGGEQLVPIASSDRWDAQLRANYSFSDTFRGEGVIRIENDSNNISEKTRKVREVRMSGTLTFK